MVHTFNCNCNPESKQHFLHHFKCKEAALFVKRYKSLPAILEGAEDAEDYRRICCCSPEIEHNVNLRVRLYKNKCDLPKLFLEASPGQLKYANNIPFREPIWRDFQAIGFEKILRTIYLGFQQERKRIIFVYGPDGSGKTPVAKQMGNMFVERKCYNEVKYINMDKISSIRVLVSRIGKASNFLQHRDYIKNIPKNLEVFIVLENINYLLE